MAITSDALGSSWYQSSICIQVGDVYEFADGSRVMCGDSTVEADMPKLMEGAKADMCFTIRRTFLDYLHGKKKKTATLRRRRHHCRRAV